MRDDDDVDGVARRLLVVGRVQMVGFRWFAFRAAQQLGLRGWVRNLPDGRVEILAAGDAQALAQLEAVIQKGPALARVSSVEKEDIPHEVVTAKSFEMR